MRRRETARLVLAVAGTLAMVAAVMATRDYADVTLMAAWVAGATWLVARRQWRWIGRLALATALSVVWVSCAGPNYCYNRPYLTVNGASLYALFAWACGLFVVYMIHAWIARAARQTTRLRRLAVFCTVYWILLVAFEAYGYHTLQIRDTAVSQYPELPLLRCMHMPGWMRAVYFSMGPVFFVLCEPLWRAGEAGRQPLLDPVTLCGRSPATRSGPMPESRPTAIATQE
jgi:hypothetical protein